MQTIHAYVVMENDKLVSIDNAGAALLWLDKEKAERWQVHSSERVMRAELKVLDDELDLSARSD